MITLVEGNFHYCERRLGAFLTDAPAVDVGEWHSQDISGNPALVTHELPQVSMQIPINATRQSLADTIAPNLPWAENHFMERVSGKPMNPPPSSLDWGAVQDKDVVKKHMKDFDGDGVEKFSHTYPERFFPKHAGRSDPWAKIAHTGIHFPYGDLLDVVHQLASTPMTRQAYLPVWFPEDTGAVHGERVPCTLGYHFLIRAGKLHITYMIRSCDFIRHFKDDVYLAARLGQWMAEQVDFIWQRAEEASGGEEDVPEAIMPGFLTMHIMSLHVFEGDMPKMRRTYGTFN